MKTMHVTQSFLLAQFQEFYAEIIRLKAAAQTNSWQGQTDPEVLPTDDEMTRRQHPIWLRLLAHLHQLAQEAGTDGGPCVADAYREAQYAMAALADETFLQLDWTGKDEWRGNLLESKLFQSHVAGERLFEKIDHLLESREPGCGEMAAMYLLALSLGFRGKYWGIDDHGQIARYRRELFALVFRRNPDLLHESKHLFPEAYRHTLDQSRAKKLPNPKGWAMGLVACVFGFVLVAHGVWWYVTADIDHLVRQILAIG